MAVTFMELNAYLSDTRYAPPVIGWDASMEWAEWVLAALVAIDWFEAVAW